LTGQKKSVSIFMSGFGGCFTYYAICRSPMEFSI